MTTISEKLSTRKPESEQDKLPCKEEDHHLNMEEVTGLLQKLQVLHKKKMKKLFGIQLNQDKFSMLMSRLLLLLLPRRLPVKIEELLLIDFWMTTILERHSMRKLESEQDKLPCKEVDHHPNMEEVTGLLQKQQQALPKKKMKAFGTQLNQENFLKNQSKRLLRLLPLKTELRIKELLLTDF